MMNRSLWLRMMVLILIPLLLAAILMMSWRFQEAQRTAEQLFDRTLIALTLAVSRDIAISGGDTLSISTRDLMSQASGSQVFYHVRGPDGSYVTGYAYPPKIPAHQEQLALFDTEHQNLPVRVAVLTEVVSVNGVKGQSITTVWQRQSLRSQFALQLATRAAILILILMLTVIVMVFFGVRYGLKPLRDLEKAIEKRSPNDLTLIKRKIPVEAEGIVQRLNLLFNQLSQSFAVRDRLISNAAHQLRNPIASIQSMAEAAQSAKSLKDMRLRVDAITDASKHVSRLTHQMLSLEKLQTDNSVANMLLTDIVVTVSEQSRKSAEAALARGIEFSFNSSDESVMFLHDPVLISESIKNLIDNAIQHGGDELSHIEVEIHKQDSGVSIHVHNDGKPIPTEEQERIFERFAQVAGSKGSGLGLSIVAEVARLHGGSCQCSSCDDRLCFQLLL